jgi:hypothetical protein
MGKFICKKCNKSKSVSNYTVKVIDDKVVVPEAVCCDSYMTQKREKGAGFGSIRKGPDGSVMRKPRPWE